MTKKAWMPSSDTELYQKVLVAFSVVELVMGLALYMLTTTTKPVLYGLFVVAVICAVLAHRFWHSRPVRVVCRGFVYLLIGGFLLAAVIALARSGEDMAQGWTLFWVNSLAMVHTILLFLTPAMALASLHERRLDVNFLRGMTVVNTLLAGALYLIPSVYERIEVGVDNLYFRVFCMACVAVTMVAAFLISPSVRLKKPMMKQKRKDEPEQTSEQTE